MRAWAEGIAIVTVMVCLATACGGGAGTLSLDPLAAAATKTHGAGAFRFDLTETLTAQGQNVRTESSGVADPATGAVRQHVVLSGLDAGKSKRVEIDAIELGGALYMRSPDFPKEPGGKHWAKIDLMAQRFQVVGGLTGVHDPSQGLAELLAAASSKKLGDEILLGAPMTHYHVDVDPTRPNPRLPAGEREKARKALAQITNRTGWKRIPLDAWVDGNGYVRRMRMSGSLGAKYAFSLTLDFRDFGTKATIEPPPAADTAS